ncbi:sensor histidine kinase [Cupriavidus plantarum]|uniref:histidine kinase n=1 Tax=Cupriavidus plantarum TaxID=942865 RepID=A0A316F2X5_9BURK|nr:sensor histidine kinase [Cupriavidus plantarum]PWK39011.1 signal transduction histidine kinase [Cupriavidus plantarum]RLK36203.1 signal transduction histidine kinase [Cupriavidus plantarum]CAG2150157.1 Sensor protein QseC [Cupriavidus plantarum]SMR68008.1 signal transduction histidine kinase [Cupriavidus plantarum]
MWPRHQPPPPSPATPPAAGSRARGGARGATNPSLRIHLLRALATPLFALVLTSGSLSYWLAAHYTTQVFDRALYGVANNIAQQIRIAGPRLEQDIPMIAQTLVEAEGSDRIYWRIHGPDGLIGGMDTWLGYGTGQTSLHDARLFYAWFSGRQVRAVRLPVTLPSPANDEYGTSTNASAPGTPEVTVPRGPIVVEVAELLDRRETAANEILLSVSVPLLLLLLLGSLILSHVLKEELVPLQILTDKLNRQTARSLAALDETQVPAEVEPLIRGLNALLSRLRDALDAQRKFIADAAHQLRTPLTAVKLHADRAMEADTLDVARHALREVQTAADRAVRLSNQLLSLARAEPGLSLERLGPVEHFDLAELAFEIGAEWVPQALARRIDLGFEVLPGPTFTGGAPAQVRGNRLLMREALSNLIDNAVKYVPAGGRITVRAGGETMGHRGMAVVMIEDNGPGIPPARRDEVFKRFFRGDDTPGVARQAAPSGAGLGLAIVHEIVTLHQGTIRIEDVPAPVPVPAAVHEGAGAEASVPADAAPRRPSMRFVIRIPCEPAPAPSGLPFSQVTQRG